MSKFMSLKSSLMTFVAVLCTALPSALCQAQFLSAPFVSLSGSLSPAVTTATDLGPADPDLRMDHMLLQLKRSPRQEQAVRTELESLQDPKSPEFHQWMSSVEFGRRYGLSAVDIQRITTWLQQSGMTVENVNDARNVIQFSGSAAQVSHTFHTAMHNVQTQSGTHLTNMSEPQVPADLADLIEGVPLSDFKPHPLVVGAHSVQRDPATGKFHQVGSPDPAAPPNLTTGSGTSAEQLVAPGDFAKIYDLQPVWSAGYTGKGQTVVVVEDTLMYGPDMQTFRQAFGLSTYAGTFQQGSPAGSHPCANPGITSNSIEAALDAEWAGATAPDATIYLAACQDTITQFGGLLAVMNLLSQKVPPQTMSVSYGECEANMGTIQLNQFSYAFQQAVAEGVSVFVSSGDEGPASCDANESYATQGVTASGFATTPYAVAVGGTDFLDYIQGAVSQYWSSTNSPTYESALSYVPEKTWNDSCADSAFLAYKGVAQAYGTTGACNTSTGSRFVTTSSGSGAPSSIYAKPAWQVVNGNPADSVRDIPDVSLFSANGFYGHGLVFCESQAKFGGTACNYSNPATAVFQVAGGTSFASPALAGIFSLITQKYGRQGNPNPGFYSLAQTQYGTNAKPISTPGCNSSLGNQSSTNCVFHDVTSGSIDLPCKGGPNCYGGSSTVYGVLSSSTATFIPAYPTTTGWDFATGLGTVDANVLLANWPTTTTVFSPGPSPTATPAPGTVNTLGGMPMPTDITDTWPAASLPQNATVPASQSYGESEVHAIAAKLAAKAKAAGIPGGAIPQNTAGFSASFSGFQNVPIVASGAPNDTVQIYASLSADVNKDGKMDLITVQADGNVNVLLNRGTGRFSDFKVTSTNSSAVTTGVYFVYATLADINNDGYPDIVALDIDNNAAFVYLNNHNGTFANPTQTNFNFSVPTRFNANGGGVVAMDINGDGILDLVAVTHTTLAYNAAGVRYGTLMILVAPGKGDGTFGPTVEQDVTLTNINQFKMAYQNMTVADMNKDGKQDLVMMVSLSDANYNQITAMFVGLNQGNGQLAGLPASFAAATGASTGAFGVEGSIAVADVNGDGNPDILFGPGTPGLWLALGNGDGTVQKPVEVLTQPGIAKNGLAGLLQFADVNGDGIIDAVAYTAGSTAVYLGTGKGQFNPQAAAQLVSGQTASEQPLPADYNGDGKVDIAVVDAVSQTMGFFQGNNATFAGPSTIAPPKEPAMGFQVVATGDLNGDGIPDLVAFHGLGAAMSTYPELVTAINDGKGNFTTRLAIAGPVLSAASLNAVEPLLVDFNGDGHPDLLLEEISYASPQKGPYLALNNGDNTFATPVPLGLPGVFSCAPSSVAVGDLNGDGKPDVVEAYNGDNTCNAYPVGKRQSGFVVFMNQGGGKFTSVFYPYGYAAMFVKLADLNGDGKLDMIISDASSTNGFYYLYDIPGNGDGTFNNAGAQLLLENTVVSTIIPGDFDGDGKQDLAIGVITQVDGNNNPLTNTTGLYTMKGNGDFTFQLPIVYTSGTYPLSGQYADLNGDGRPDLILADDPFVYFTDIQVGDFIPLINLGSGTFAQGPPYFTAEAASGVAFAGDFNGDGAVDALISMSTVAQGTGSNSPFFTQLFLNNGGVAARLTASSAAVAQASPVTLTETLTSTVSSAQPSGSVTFYSNGVAFQTVPLQSGTATLTTTTLPVGTDAITASYSGDANFNPLAQAASVTVTVTTLSPAFSLTAATSSSLTMQRGTTSVVPLVLTTNATFSGTVSFTCQGMPSESSCIVTPAAVPATAGQAYPISVVIATTAPNNSAVAQDRRSNLGYQEGGLALAAMLIVLPLRRRSRKGVMKALAVLLLAAGSFGAITGCSNNSPKYSGTPAGTYNVVVTGQSGTITQTATLQLTITQ